MTDPNGGVTAYVYDGFGELIQRVSPDSGPAVYRYDPNGNLTQRVRTLRARSRTTPMTLSIASSPQPIPAIHR